MDSADSSKQMTLLLSRNGSEEGSFVPQVIGLDEAMLEEVRAVERGRVSELQGADESTETLGWHPPKVEDLLGSIPGCEIESMIACGGMGVVYRARQARLGRVVAVKLLPQTAGEVGDELVERFKREARAMAKLNHPAILPVFEFGETPAGMLYYVMEYIDGCDVAAVIRAQGLLEPAHAVAIVCRVCEGLEFAHTHGIIHRDIKPSNIMVGRQGAIKVADFGLAKFTRDDQIALTLPNAAWGTPQFLAPELALTGAVANARTDIFALGVSLYQMVTGVIPRGAYLSPSQRVPGIDRRLDAVIDKAMAQRAEERFGSAAEMHHALLEAVAPPKPVPRTKPAPPPQEAPPARSEPEMEPAPREEAKPRRGWSEGRYWMAASALVMMLAAGLVLWPQRPVKKDGQESATDSSAAKGLSTPEAGPAPRPSEPVAVGPQPSAGGTAGTAVSVAKEKTADDGNPWRPAAAVALGSFHSVALMADGTIWAWGRNNCGQLGDGTTEDRAEPEQIGEDRDWVSVFAGSNSTFAIKRDGELWAWGMDQDGVLGNGFTANRDRPTRITQDTDWAMVSSGGTHTLALKRDGTLWAWGSNNHGQLGDGTNSDKYTPRLIGYGGDWRAIFTGYECSAALKKDGTLWTWGCNAHGQLGDGAVLDKAVPVQVWSSKSWRTCSAYGHQMMAIKADGTLWAWGSNEDGQLGDGTIGDKSNPMQIGTDKDWKMMAPGDFHTVAMKNDGTLWTWGGNNDGQLGDGTTENRTSPTKLAEASGWQRIACGARHTVAMKSDGSLWAWGHGGYGQLGSGTRIAVFAPAQVSLAPMRPPARQKPSLTQVAHSGAPEDEPMRPINPAGETVASAWGCVATGSYHTAGVKSDGTLWAWGENNYGQLGDGTHTDRTAPGQIGKDVDWQVVAAGYFHTMAIKGDGTLWTWGANYSGQLGDGTTSNKFKPTQIGENRDWQMISAGEMNTMALKRDGTLWGWGQNDSGQLGDGTMVNRAAPTRIGEDADWRMLSVGETHTVALKRDGTLWGWGQNSHGQLGTSKSYRELKPMQIGTDADWQTVAAGAYFTLALKRDGTLWGWGLNNCGQLGDGTTSDRTAPTAIVGEGANWQTIFAGSRGAVGTKTDDSLWAWGSNRNGEIGDGTQTDKSSPRRIGGDSGWWVWGRHQHTVALKRDGTLWAWGMNNYGQLGDGTNVDKQSPVRLGAAPAAAAGDAKEMEQMRHLWTDNQGRKLDAYFVRLEGDKLSLRVPGSSQIVALPLARFSKEDRSFAKSLSSGARPGATKSAATVGAEQIIDLPLQRFRNVTLGQPTAAVLQVLPFAGETERKNAAAKIDATAGPEVELEMPGAAGVALGFSKEEQILKYFKITFGTYRTSEGVGIGSTVKDFVQAYGPINTTYALAPEGGAVRNFWPVNTRTRLVAGTRAEKVAASNGPAGGFSGDAPGADDNVRVDFFVVQRQMHFNAEPPGLGKE